jgi:transketolase
MPIWASTQPMNERIRLRILRESHRAGVGHIGSALSIADILATLFGGVLRGEGEDRERFLLSKGHAVLALYAALCESDRMQEATLQTFCADGSMLGAHPEHALDGIDFSTGSLGHGLSIGAGAALAARLQGSTRRTFVLLSDAELNEGSIWEAVMFAAHKRLSSLIAIVDVNGQQALGYTRDVIDLEPLGRRWSAFGWDVQEVDGHDTEALQEAIASASAEVERPHVLLARTTFGRGVSFMENQIAWHYWPLSDEQLAQAVAEVESVMARDQTAGRR